MGKTTAKKRVTVKDLREENEALKFEVEQVGINNTNLLKQWGLERADWAKERLDWQKERESLQAKATPVRRKLPLERQSATRKFSLPPTEDRNAPHKLYASIGFFEDGTLGEVFLKADRVGTFASGVLDALSIVLSMALQYGVPPQVMLNKLRGSKFEPAGLTGDPEFRTIKSPIDYLARWLIVKVTGVKEEQPKLSEDESTIFWPGIL